MMKGPIVAMCVAAVVLAMAAEVSHGAITCNQVAGSLGQCMEYLSGQQPAPSAACCTGIKNLNTQAATTADRRQACTCMVKAASNMKNLKDENAKSLPVKCGVNLPFAVSRNIKCSDIP